MVEEELGETSNTFQATPDKAAGNKEPQREKTQPSGSRPNQSILGSARIDDSDEE
ncbi:920_t:CDS:1, partial [Acaulospora morrowiae]